MKPILYKTYFSHDIYARQDNKIKNLLLHFRKENEDKAKAALCVYWWIIEDMHADEYKISNIAVYADDYRCDVDFLKSILEDFDLFRVENECYISDRVLKNFAEQEEKSKKARQSAKGRWVQDNNHPSQKTSTASDNEIEYDEKIVNEFIQIFNTEFEKSQIISSENKKRINKISKENNITAEIWEKTIQNAKRGWDIKGEGNKKPNLKNILDDWDLFASDDYYLAPDREAAQRKKDEAAKKEQEEKEAERKQQEKEADEFMAIKNSIHDKETAIKYLNKIARIPSCMVKTSKIVREYCEKYNFTPEDVLALRGEK